MKNVEDLYPLSPMQEAMLLHSLRGVGGDVLFNQLCFDLVGPLNAEALLRAWQRVIDRHPALRTLFVPDQGGRPLQVVRRSIKLTTQLLDWRSTPADEQAAAIDAFCDEDRGRGFDTARAPLCRIALIRCQDERWRLIWSSHHLVLDRWCIDTVFEDLSALYRAELAGQDAQLAPATRFRDYIAWLQGQQPSAAEDFWRRQLAGLRKPSAIALERGRDVAGDTPTEAALVLTGERHARLKRFAREQGATLSTVVQAAWALLLNRYGGHQDIVIGNAVSGRPPELAGVENIVGSFVNNVPLRFSLPADDTIGGLLRRIQRAQQARIPFEHVSLASMHQWCALPPSQHLFDSLLVWLSPTAERGWPDVRIRPCSRDLGTAFPFTLSIADEASGLQLFGERDPRRALLAPVAEILEHLASVLDAVVASAPDTALAELQGFRSSATAEAALRAAAPTAVSAARSAKAHPTSDICGGRVALEHEMLDELVRCEWRQVLDIEDIDADANFFELGGDSLHAARLHARIEAATRTAVPMLALFRQPTIRSMTETLAREDWPLIQSLATPIRAHGTRAPLFCVASPEVSSIGYAILAARLDPEQPVYVLQAPPDVDHMRRLSQQEMPALGAKYVDAMRDIQPRGPYRILGMCTGAHVALAMAHRLQSDGESTEFFGIVDTQAFFTMSRLYYLRKLMLRADWYATRLRQLVQLAPAEQWQTIKRIALRRVGTVGRRLAPAAAGEGTPAAPAPAQTRAAQSAWTDGALPGTKPPDHVRYRGTITLFRVRRQDWWRVREATLGWGLEAERVEVVNMGDGEHESLLREPQVRDIAARITRHLGEHEGPAMPVDQESVA